MPRRLRQASKAYPSALPIFLGADGGALRDGNNREPDGSASRYRNRPTSIRTEWSGTTRSAFFVLPSPSAQTSKYHTSSVRLMLSAVSRAISSRRQPVNAEIKLAHGNAVAVVCLAGLISKQASANSAASS